MYIYVEWWPSAKTFFYQQLGHVYLSSKTYFTKISAKGRPCNIHFCFFPDTYYILPIHPAIAAIHRIKLDVHCAVLQYILLFVRLYILAFYSQIMLFRPFFPYCNSSKLMFVYKIQKNIKSCIWHFVYKFFIYRITF